MTNTAYMPGIVLAFPWGLYNSYHLLPEPEKSYEIKVVYLLFLEMI